MIVAPDALTLLISWLQQHPSATALINGRVYRRLPGEKTYPCVLVQRIGGGVRAGTMHWLHDPLLQVDVYDAADRAVRCERTAATLYALIGQEFRGVISTPDEQAVVSGATLGGLHVGWEPDAKSAEITRARFDVALTLHPLAST